MSILKHLTKTYIDKTYKHTTMVRHKGIVVGLVMDDRRQIYYSVLGLENTEVESPLDVNYWPENPKILNFSNEIVQVGYGIVDPTKMPLVKKGSRTEAEPGTLRAEEIDPFLSTTARFTEDAPFVALSDNKYIYIFRQSIDSQHQDMVYARNSDGSEVLDQNDNKVPIVNDTLLVDRFILTGTVLQPKREVRYKRSRNKYRAQSNKDSLGAEDMEKKPFYEPTQELDFVKNLRDGRFSVLLLPTQIADIWCWQIFTHNSQTGNIDSFNVERSADGLFNTQGTQFYTSPDPQYQKSVFERQPGKCPFTGQDLIPISDRPGITETGISQSSFQLLANSNIRSIESGMSAVLYYQQEKEATGYDQQEKPVKRNARVMLAVTTGEPNNTEANNIGVLDFAVSREGQLAAVPSQLNLPQIGPEAIESQSGSDASPSQNVVQQVGLQFDLPHRQIVSGEIFLSNQLSINGVTIAEDLTFGKCLSFDGVNDYIQLPEMNIDYSTGFTVAVWVYYQSFKSYSRIIDLGNGVKNDNILLLNDSTGKLIFHLFMNPNEPSGKKVVVDGILETNKWLHLVATIDTSGNAKIYKNGVEVGSGEVYVPNSVNQSTNYIGKSWNQKLFHGKIADLKVYNRPLSPAEIEVLSKAPLDVNRALQLHLPLDEIEGGIVADSSLNQLNGTVHGATVVNDSKFGSCLSFDGNNDYIQLPEMNIDYSKGFSVAAWVCFHRFYTSSRIIEFSNGHENLSIMFATSGTKEDLFLAVYIDQYASNAKMLMAKGILETNKWLYLVGTIDSSGNAKIYKNGVEVASGSVDLPASINRSQNIIGNSPGVHRFLDGKMHDLKVYNRALLPQEIEILRDGGKPDPVEPPTTSLSQQNSGGSGTIRGERITDLQVTGLQFYLQLHQIQNGQVRYWSSNPLNEVTFHGGTVVNDSKFGNCFSFDGVDDYIEPSDMTIDYSTGLTIATWIYYESINRLVSIIQCTNNPYLTDSLNFFNLETTTNLLLSTDRHSIHADGVLELNKWLHLVVTIDTSGNAKLYKNGVEVASDSVALPANNSRNRNCIGRSIHDDWGRFHGRMAELQVYNRALLPQEIEILRDGGKPEPVESPTSLLYQNSVRSVLQFDGNTDINCGNNINLANQSFTIEFWAKRGEFNGVNKIIVGQGQAQSNHALAIGFRGSSNNHAFFMAFYGNAIDTDEGYTDSEWHHWACTYDKSTYTQKIYRDGEGIKTRIADSHTLASGEFFIGRFSGTDKFNGYLAEMRVWNRVRSQNEIQADLNRRLEGNEAGLVAYWRLDEGVGNTVNDLTNNGYHGTIAGNSQWQYSAVPITQSTLSQNQPDEVVLPMPLLQTDSYGLTVSGALLRFAQTQDTPTLFDSANGKLGLYFRGITNEFFVAYYDTNTSKAQYVIDADSEKLTFVARSAEAEMDRLSITVGNGASSDTCNVTIANLATGLTETWQQVPRAVEQLVAVINGTTTEQAIAYNYEQNATSSQTKTAKGSLQCVLVPGTATGKVQNGTATSNGSTTSCQWVSQSPGQALSFDGQDDYLSVQQSQQFDIDNDLTLEAWLKFSNIGGIGRVIHHNSPDSKYTLGFKNVGVNKFFAGVGGKFKQSKEAISSSHWEHIAAVYKQSYALDFRGDDGLSCPHNSTLDITKDLTIEVFLKLDDLSMVQGILTKGHLGDGTQESVSYSIYTNNVGQIVFAFEDKDGQPHNFASEQPLQTGVFYKIAVTRQHRTEIPTGPYQQVQRWTDILFYIDRNEAGDHKHTGQDSGGNTLPLEIGKGYLNGQELYLQGIISEVRLWSKALPKESICMRIQGNEEGLISWWQFEEKEGNIAKDSVGENHATLKGAKWVKSPDIEASTLLIYRNGSPVETEEMQPEPSWGNSQFTLGANKNGSVQECFAGTMEEVRVWKVARTQEQIQDNLFTRLKGEKENLVAYYTFELDSDTQLRDYSLLGNHLSLGSGNSKPTAVISTAPISDDIALVQSALGGVTTQFHDVIHSRPTVQEYGDLQYDSNGNMIGVLKRCYSYIKNGKWHLLTGYKVGNLVSEWIGQVQADPQIIGYIEGAPPVPSENLTGTSMKLSEVEDYSESSVIEIEEAEEVNYIYSSSRETGFNMSFALKAVAGFKSKTSAGFGMTTSVEETNITAGLKTSFEHSDSQTKESTVSYGRNTTKSSRMELAGVWENIDDTGESYINKAVGRRFLPKNLGYALVQSDTMDVFALRLAHNNALVSYRMLPNPDIPKDWNIILFPINSTYTKQGTLDGKVGLKEDGSVQCDPDYPNATVYGQYSYFKPVEAYRVKKRIEREQQELQTYYQSYDASAEKTTSSNDIPKSLTALNIVNTYVWTADGGFFSESTQVMESIQESTTGSYSFQGMAGITVEANTAISKAAIGLEIDAMFGGHINTIKSKEKETEKSFSINVEVEGEEDIQLYVNTEEEEQKYPNRNEGGGAYDEQGKPIKRPGKVDAYRFMTFYLQPSKENFEDFFNKVIYPIRLANRDEPNAVALRQANHSEKKPKCWRVFHRVTFVSRVLPEIEATNAPPMQKAIRAANIESNYQLIKKLEPFVKNQTHDYSVFADAVRQTLKTQLPELQPYEMDIIEYAALYFGVSTES